MRACKFIDLHAATVFSVVRWKLTIHRGCHANIISTRTRLLFFIPAPDRLDSFIWKGISAHIPTTPPLALTPSHATPVYGGCFPLRIRSAIIRNERDAEIIATMDFSFFSVNKIRIKIITSVPTRLKQYFPTQLRSIYPRQYNYWLWRNTIINNNRKHCTILYTFIYLCSECLEFFHSIEVCVKTFQAWTMFKGGLDHVKKYYVLTGLVWLNVPTIRMTKSIQFLNPWEGKTLLCPWIHYCPIRTE